MKMNKKSAHIVKQDKALWSSIHAAMAAYARKCRHSYLSMFSI